MKKIYKNIILLLALMFTISCVPYVNVNAAVSDMYNSYRKLAKKNNVAPNKTFKIKFNRPMEKAFVNSAYIKVLDEKDNQISVTLRINTTGDELEVKPTKEYVAGKTYRLIVSDKIKDSNGEKIGNGVMMEFTVGNLYSGLPLEEGLVVIGNKAYSIEYLRKNMHLQNDIIKGDYEILYLYDETKENIKDIFGDKFLDGSKPPKDYDRSKPMIYVNESGKEYVYSWDTKEGKYVLIPPSIDVKVGLNSTLKLVTLTVTTVNGVNGEVKSDNGSYYFKTDRNNDIANISSSSSAKNQLAFSESTDKVRVYVLDKNKETIAYTDVVTTYEGARKSKLVTTVDQNKGNSFGNINNNGYVAGDSYGYIYYSNTSDGNKLYRMNFSGTENREVCGDYAQYINHSDGWIYYSNYSDKGKLYRIKPDGSGRQKLVDDIAAYINVVGQWIYYANHSDGGNVYRVLKDGSNAQKSPWGQSGIPISKDLKDETAYVNVEGDWIYYSNVSDRGRPYVINKDGTYRAKLSDETAASIQIHEGWIYYTTANGELKKVDKEGTGKSVNISGKVTQVDKGYHLNAVGEWIYYSNADDKGTLYKVKVDGSGQKVKVANMPVTYISILENYIYFVSADKLYRLHINATVNDKPVQVSKGGTGITIKQIDDINVEVSHQDINLGLSNIEKKYLPDKVPAILSDNTIKQVVVVWDTKNVSIRNGVRIYNGDVVGYNKKIKLNMKIPSEMLNASNTIQIYSNPGSGKSKIEIFNDFTVEEYSQPAKLLIGDEVRLYDDPLLLKPIKTAKVVREGNVNKATLTSLKLDKTGTVDYYITVIRKDKTESEATKIVVGDIPEIINSVYMPVRDPDDIGVKIDGRDFSITDWRTGSIKRYISDAHEVYISTQNNLDFSDRKIKPMDEKIKEGQDWNGGAKQLVDSLGNQFKQGKYNMFVASYYIDDPINVTPDKNGSRPIVKGKIVSEPEPISVEEDVPPSQPTLKSESKQSGGTMTLAYTPKAGEIAFLVPTEIYLKNGSTYELRTDIYENFRKWLGEDPEYGLKNPSPGVDFYDNFKNSGLYEKYEKKEKLISKNIVTMLVGDGKTKEINVPVGMQHKDGNAYNSKYMDTRYKLIVFNKVGASKQSDGTLIVDNKPPVLKADAGQGIFVKDGDKFKAGEDYIKIQSIEENATLYIIRSIDTLTNVADLEQAVRERKAYKYSLKTGVTETLTTAGIKANPSESVRNYKICVADAAGNVTVNSILEYDETANSGQGAVISRNPIFISIYIVLDKLENVIKDAEDAIMGGELPSFNQQNLIKVVDEANRMVKDAKNLDDLTKIVTQPDIESMIKRLQTEMMKNGAVSRYMDAFEVIQTMKNKFATLREFDFKSSLVDMNNIATNLWLPKEQKIPNINGGKDTVKIEWIIREDMDNSIKIVDDEGVITRPAGTNPVASRVKLRAVFTINGRVIDDPNGKADYSSDNDYSLSVKPLQVYAIPNNPKNESFIVTTDFYVDSDSSINVYLRDVKIDRGRWTPIEINTSGERIEAKYSIGRDGNGYKVSIEINPGSIPAGFTQSSLPITVEVGTKDGRVVGVSGKIKVDVKYKDLVLEVQVN